MKNYETELYEKIAEVVSFVCNNPLIYVSETDIHALMMSEFMKIGPLAKLYSTKVTIGQNKKGKVSKKKYKTMLVHKEYGHNTKIGERSDIVIFDKEDVAAIDDPINLVSNYKYLNPKYIFEFGTEKAAQTIKEYEVHLKKDFKKISKSKDTGFIIHIQRRFVRAKKKSKRYLKNQLKYEEYKKTTMNVWENIKNQEKLKVLIFFVEIGAPLRPVGSKVKMFYPFMNKKGKYWDAINLKEIKSEITDLLNMDL
jgi:hypothetical protein